MTWAYQILDILSTATEAISVYLFCSWLCKKPRFSAFTNKCIIIGVYFLSIYAMTWFTELGAYKIPVLIIVGLTVIQICYADSFVTCGICYEAYLISIPVLTEGLGMLIGYAFYQDDIIVAIDGDSLMRWEIYAIILIARIIVLCLSYLMCRNFTYQVNYKDFILLTTVFIFAIVFFMSDVYMHLNLGVAGDRLHYIVSTALPAAGIMTFLYAKNTMYLREQEQRGKLQIAQLQQQFAYYQEKMKDEERVRSIYHDLKNHLLVMENRQNTEETRQMAKTLRSQITAYEDYAHTGNDFLDIIVKDKAAKAREKQIDFSAMVDFHGIDFIEPLDISTIFGNAIDNAIEASEKLPESKRLITVKAERFRDMLLITVENNTPPGNHLTERTTKQDRLVHGFGIPNIKKAVEKYGGQCSFQQEEGTYRLNILIPCP
ncbi:sensor histidine kinase [Bifidobacterium lemurum]|nr:GHKL domain-containing protein [Bifidobacterium lemurum]QOL34141.1 sensor histidine kinase [Bifidobacterium lemurum]